MTDQQWQELRELDADAWPSGWWIAPALIAGLTMWGLVFKVLAWLI